MIENESKLIRKTKKGCKESANILIDAYYDEIYIFACRQVGDKREAMDITQEIFFTVWQLIESFDERKAGFRTWLYRVATNKVIDYRRKNRLKTVSIDEIKEPVFEASFDKRMFIEEVQAFIAGLNPQVGQIAQLYIYGGYSFPEIAIILKEPEAKLKSQYYRAIKKLRKEFSGNE